MFGEQEEKSIHEPQKLNAMEKKSASPLLSNWVANTVIILANPTTNSNKVTIYFSYI